MGIFTMNAILIVMAQIVAFGVWGKVRPRKEKFRWLFFMYRKMMEINRGSLAATVYRSI